MERVINDKGYLIRSPRALALVQEALTAHFGTRLHLLDDEEHSWSTSGALHLAAWWRATETPILVKLGVNHNQLYWMQQVATAAPDLLPQLFASGAHLGPYPLAWLALERVSAGPLWPGWGGAEFTMLLEAAVRFQQVAATIEPHAVKTMDAALLRSWLTVGVAAAPPGPVVTVMERLEQDWAWLVATCGLDVCHGDVHMCNAVTRTPPPEPTRALLIDCQPIRQPWAFDAAYAQVLNSTDCSRVGYHGLVPKIARLRADRGLPSCTGETLARVERLTLAWFAIRLWGLTPNRHSIADYRRETERYIRDSAC